jgi:type I restriction enzyme S subunit
MGVENWTKTRLGDVIRVKHGWPFKSELFDEKLTGRPIVVAVGNFAYTGGFRFDSTLVKEYRGEYPPDFVLAPGDILLVMTCQTAGGEILGIPARIPNDGRTYLHNQRLGKVVVKNSALVDPAFLYWVFLSESFNQELCASATGTKIVHTAPDRIEAYSFDRPPLDEQRAIARILGTLDDKIELNRRMNQTLEAIARAIFKSWFVDFDPVRAKAAGRKPPGLAPAIADLFPDSFEDSELGEIPTGWTVGTLGTVAAESRGAVRPADIERGTPYIALEHMPQRSIALNSWGVSDDIASGKLRFKVGDILFGKLRPYFHKVGPAPLDGVCSTDIVVCRPKGDEWYGFALLQMASDDFVAHTERGSTGTKMPRTNWRDMAAYPVVLPKPEIAQRFTGIVRPMVDRIRASIFEQATLAALRDALLPKLISGELRVAEAERIGASVD